MKQQYVKLYEDFYLDRILDKINATGMDSLTSIEKNYLNRVSKGDSHEVDQFVKKSDDGGVNLDVDALVKGFDEYIKKQWEKNTIVLPTGYTVKLFDDVMVEDEGDHWEGSVVEIHDDYLVVKDDGEFKNKIPLDKIVTFDQYHGEEE